MGGVQLIANKSAAGIEWWLDTNCFQMNWFRQFHNKRRDLGVSGRKSGGGFKKYRHSLNISCDFIIFTKLHLEQMYILIQYYGSTMQLHN